MMYDEVSDVLPSTMPKRYAAGRQINLIPFLKRLNAVTEPYGLYNEVVEDATIQRDTVYMTGLWLAKKQLPENNSSADIRVLWHVAPRSRRLSISPMRWNRRRYFFWQIVMHELVHRYQYVYGGPNAHVRVYKPRSTDRTIREQQDYYGQCDEIEAHAHDAAVELFTWWPHLSFRAAVREARAVTGPVTPTLLIYKETFRDSPGHPAYKHFKRKMRSWYDCVRDHADFYQSLELPIIV